MVHIRSRILTPIFIAIFLTMASCGREDVEKYAPTETFPNDKTLQNVENRKAMIIIAHDDDMCAMSGTISALNRTGWEIRVLSIPQTDRRNKAHIKACQKLLDSVMFFNFTKSEVLVDSTKDRWYPISKSRFEEIFKYEIVQKDLIIKVNQFNPSVIFTLDNEIGGYGHPEHVFISQMVVDLAQTDSISPQYIYQSVFTDHMEKSIMARHSKRMKSWGFPGDDWEKAKQAYHVDGMPAPSVQINIELEAEAKMSYLMSYNERERKTMGFYIPAFFEYEAKEYFSIFDREFYKIIKIN